MTLFWAIISIIVTTFVTIGMVATFAAHTQVTTTKAAKTWFSISAIPIFVLLVHFALTGQWKWFAVLGAGIFGGWILGLCVAGRFDGKPDVTPTTSFRDP